jgi:STE24 endopeptidase
MNQEVPISHEKEEAKRYNKIARRISILEFALGVALLLILLFAGFSHRIRDLTSSYTSSPWLLVLFYLLIIGIIFEIISLPFSIYGGFVLEHKFKLSTQRFSRWLWDHIKGLLLNFALTLILVEALYFLLREFPLSWWFLAAIIFTIFFIILSRLAPILILPIFYKFHPLEDEDLKKRLLNLAERARTKVLGVFRWGLKEKTRKANAALLGSGKTRRIILSDTLLENFSPDEIETVLAHELGHHNLKHIKKAMMIQTLISFVGWYLVAQVLAYSWSYFGLEGIEDVAGFPLIVLVFTILSLLLLPWANLFSRRQERKADEFALKITKKPDAFISMIQKLTHLNLAEYQPNKIIQFIFHSHPSPAERIDFAERLKNDFVFLAE